MVRLADLIMSTSSYYLYPVKNRQKIIDFNGDEAEKGKPSNRLCL